MNKARPPAPKPKSASAAASPAASNESAAAAAEAQAPADGAAATPPAASPKEKKDKPDKKKKTAAAESEDDDDAHTEKAPEKEDPAGVAEATQLKSEIDPIIKSGAYSKALGALTEAKGKTKELLKMQEVLALTAMDSIKADEITKIVDAASDEVLDTLMRITYAGFATGKNCPTLLTWHSKITDKSGIGAVMRAMCSRQL